MANNADQQPHTFAQIEAWISDLTAKIEESIETYSEYAALFDDMVTNDMLQHHAQESRNHFFAVKEDHHAFEHFLRTMKYELAKEKYNVNTVLPLNDPQREVSLDTINELEQMIQEYLLTYARAFCGIHENRDAAEGIIVIQSETEFSNIEARSDQEEGYMHFHKQEAERFRRV